MQVTTPIERAVEAAIAAGVPRVEAERLAHTGPPPAQVVVPLRRSEDRVRSWFDSVGWELEPDALTSALKLLGADDDLIVALLDEASLRRNGRHAPVPWKGQRWIVIPRWDEFQHPDAARTKVLPWIKDFTRQLSGDEYLALTFHQRGVLHGLRLEYARALRQLSDSTSALTRRLGQRITSRDLEALQNAGFITFSASKPASEPASTIARPDGEGDRETPSPYGDASNTTLHNRPAPPTTYACPVDYCGLNFKSQRRLDEHIANVHDGATT